MNSLPPVVILDLDDTIIDYTGSSAACWLTICQEVAPMLGVDGARLHASVMETRTWYWADLERNRIGRANPVEASRQIVTRAFEVLAVGDVSRAHALAEAYQDRRRDLVTIFPDSIKVIETLRARGHQLAMITNGATLVQRAKIERFDLARHFDYLLVEGEFGIGKPDERVYRHVLQTLDVEASDTVMVGDDLERDVAGPQRVGIAGVWVDRTGAGLPAGSTIRPDRVIRSLGALL